MSMQTSIGSEAAARAGGILAPAASWLAQRTWQVMAAILLRRAIARAEADLMALSDRTLKDIGLPRGEIRSAVREALAADRFIARTARTALS